MGSHPPLPFSAGAVRVFSARPADPNRASGEGEDGSDPPFSAAGAARRGGVDHTGFHTRCHTPPAYGGVAPVLMYPCGKTPRPARGRDDKPERAARWLTEFSARFSSSAASAPRAPGPGLARSPRAIPWPFSSATTRRTFTAPSSPGTTSPPGVAALLAGQFLISTSRIWFARMGVSLGLRSRLPTWPLSPTADGPAIVVGEVHHPVKLAESPAPEWLTIPERGLYTGVAIFGAVGSGKTSACMHPFARQLLSWQADNPERRPAALVLEVKGDFCHDIRRMLARAGPRRRLHRAES